MHDEILNIQQKNLLSLLQKFKREFYLVGGTAIALHLGHRRSIDFDLFKAKPFQSTKILNKINQNNLNYTITRNVSGQLNLIINNVTFTFFEYPYPIAASQSFEKYIKLPDLLTLSAMKAFALGRRAKWKDYVDLYFVIKNHYTILEISKKSQEIFDQQFSEKLFRAQLAFHKDIDYSEEVEYLINTPSESEIKEFLIERAIDI